MARFSHPSVVQVFDIDEDGGDYFMAMEFVKGADLRKVFDRLASSGRRMDLAEVVAVALQLGEALDHVHTLTDEQGHELGIVHRDVSPSNLLITDTGGVKLVDFGIAKWRARRADTTEVTRIRGKHCYLSPEQAHGMRVDQRADVFSFGAVLFEMVCGRRLFLDDTINGVIWRLLSGEVPDIAQVEPDCPAALGRIVRRCLRVDRDARYQSMRAVVTDLEQLARGEGLFVSPTTLSTMMQSLFVTDQSELFDNTVTLLTSGWLGDDLPGSDAEQDATVREIPVTRSEVSSDDSLPHQACGPGASSTRPAIDWLGKIARRRLPVAGLLLSAAALVGAAFAVAASQASAHAVAPDRAAEPSSTSNAETGQGVVGAPELAASPVHHPTRSLSSSDRSVGASADASSKPAATKPPAAPRTRAPERRRRRASEDSASQNKKTPTQPEEPWNVDSPIPPPP